MATAHNARDGGEWQWHVAPSVDAAYRLATESAADWWAPMPTARPTVWVRMRTAMGKRRK